MKTIKCVVVGDVDAQKTELLVTYTSKKYPTEFVPTVFENYALTFTIGDEPYTIGLFDTAGQENYKRLRPLAYRQTDVFIVCYSVLSATSFTNAKTKWIPEIRKHCPKTPFILVATQVNLRNDSETLQKLNKARRTPVTTMEGEKLAKKLRAHKYLECSAMTQEGVQDVFDEAILAALNPPIQERGCLFQ